MKNAMQLKTVIKNIAKEKHISVQLVMQNYMLERCLRKSVTLTWMMMLYLLSVALEKSGRVMNILATALH